MPLPPPGCRDKCSLRHRQRHHNHDAVQRHSYAQATPHRNLSKRYTAGLNPAARRKAPFPTDRAADARIEDELHFLLEMGEIGRYQGILQKAAQKLPSSHGMGKDDAYDFLYKGAHRLAPP
jgi:hypothetical protein